LQNTEASLGVTPVLEPIKARFKRAGSWSNGSGGQGSFLFRDFRQQICHRPGGR
jgi:hypothetical protein